jgi:type IV pilus assembly protein PilV
VGARENIVKSKSRRQGGTTLLEILISVLIFTIGIMGLIRLQATAINNSSSSKYRGDAGYFADQIIGQMWADRGNLSTYSLNGSGSVVCQPTFSASTNPNVIAWTNALSDRLPGATSAMQQIVVGANNMVTVTVCWQSVHDPLPHHFSEVAQING